MATAASIFAKLVLDSSEYTKGLNKSKTDTDTFSKQGKGSLGGLGTAFQSVTGFSLGMAGAVGMASMAMTKAIQYTKQAIEANDIYVSSIVDIARFTGDEVDAMSRLVQVADDVFLSQSELNNAMSIGAKKGLDMSVEGIKKLADEYNALATPQEKAKLLNDNFGRSGLAMGKLLEQGSKGITKSMEAIADNLVLTKESVKITYDYKKSVDALSDAQDGLKYSIAQGTMPAITKYNNTMSSFIDKVNESGIVTDTLAAGMGFLEIIMSGMNGALWDLTTAEQDANIRMEEFNRIAIEHRGVIVGIGEGAEYTEEMIKALNEAEINRYKTTTSLAIDLTKSDEDLLIAEKDLADYIKNNPWDNQGIQDRKDAVNKLKQEQQRMVDSWMLNVFTTMALADQKLSDDEQAFLLQYQVDTGMISQENADRAASYWIMANSIFNANAGIQGSINSLQGKDLYIVTHYTNEQGHGSGTVTVPENIPIIYPSSPTNYSAASVAASYANQHRALGGTTIAGSMSQVNERGIPEMVSVGNKDYLTMGSQNGTITPLSNGDNSSYSGLSRSDLEALVIAATPNYNLIGMQIKTALIGLSR